ncbi:MAG: hypothetical protein ABUK14_03880 [Desulfobacteria bacterium]|jgi:V/A-type H+-transporting ATPase subunit I
MIVKMKKVTIATLASAVPSTLNALRAWGALHVVPVREPVSKETEDVRGRIGLLEGAMNSLSSRKGKGKPPPIASARETAQQVLSMLDSRSQYQDRLQSVLKEIDRVKPLGDFSPSDFEYLRQNGLTARLYKCNRNDLNQMKISVPYAVVGEEGSLRYILTVSDEDYLLPFEEIAIPEKRLSEMKMEAEGMKKHIEDLERQLDLYVAYTASLKEESSLLREGLEFAEVAAGAGQEGAVSYIQGYCPEDDLERLRREAEGMGWAVTVEDPSTESEVPTLIRNPSWIRIIEPVFRLMGTVPGYEEYDVSLWFLISLSVFFAILVGDGGYGVLVLLGTYLARRRFKLAHKEPFILFYVFSGATILWGLITGNWFGVEHLARFPVLNWFVLPDLDSYSSNQDFMMQFCLALGAAHLTVAHILRCLRSLNSLRMLGEIGWILVLWFLYFLAGHLVLGRSIPSFATYLVILGLLLVALFSNPTKSIIRSLLLGLADLPLNIVRSFSDLVSYLRLFAVGYATLIVAITFNKMAHDLGWSSLLNGIVATSILILGHAMNIVMAALGVLVHGIRLNMLEFSTHMGMNWSGQMYRPFRKRAGEHIRQ